MKPRIRLLVLIAVAALALTLPFAYALTARPAGDSEPLETLVEYLKTAYARDYKRAYRLISAEDRRLKDENTFVAERGAFTGFTLEAAKVLAEAIRVTPVDVQPSGDRMTLKARLALPDANKLAPQLLGWDEERLNALPAGEQRSLVRRLREASRKNALPMIEGEETFNLVREAGQWRIHLNWTQGVEVAFRPVVPAGVPIELRLVQSEVRSQPGEPFSVALHVKNTGKDAIVARIGHRVEPYEYRDHLDLLECGFLLPVRLLPGNEEQFTSTYFLRPGLPEDLQRLEVSYELVVLP